MDLYKTLSMKILVRTLACFLLLSISCKKKDKTIPPDSDSVGPREFLSESKYTKLIIEIDYVSGFEPDPASVQAVVTFLQGRINKPNGIEVVKNMIASPGKNVYTLSDIREIETANRGQLTSGNTITAYALFLDKDYSDPNVLGVTYLNTSIAIFEKTIKGYSGGLTQPSTQLLETTVIEHEFGHVLGLTNYGTPMQSAHQDSQHGAHCTNKSCLMYYAVETSGIVGNLLSQGNPPLLDQACINDLKANGGK
jgi:hypothetical protein